MPADTYTPNLTIATTLEPMAVIQPADALAAEPEAMQTAEPDYLTKDEVMQTVAQADTSVSATAEEPAVAPGSPYFSVSVVDVVPVKGGNPVDPILKFNVNFNVFLDDGSVVPVSRILEIDSCNLIDDALKQINGKVIRLESQENKAGKSQAKVAKRMRELAGIPHRGNFV